MFSQKAIERVVLINKKINFINSIVQENILKQHNPQDI